MGPASGPQHLRLLLVVALLACHDDGGPEPTLARGTDVIWTIGEHAGALGDIRHLRVSESGLVAVGQESEGFILLYDADGRQIGRLGRRGEGPGEFQGSPVFNWIGDSLFAGDARLSVFSSAGAFVRGARWAPTMTLSRGDTTYHPFFGGGVLLAITANAERLLIASVNNAMGAAPDGWQEQAGAPQQAVIRVAADGNVGAVYSRGAVFEPEGCRGSFCRRTIAAVSPDAERVVIASPGREDQDSIRYLVATFDIEGTPLSEQQFSMPQREIPEAVWDSIDQARGLERSQVDAIVMDGRPQSGRGGHGRSEKAPRVQTYPAFRALIVSRDGSIWLQRFRGRVWMVLSADGAPKWEVALEHNVRLQAVAGDTLWAVRLDDDDVPSVLRLELKPRRHASSAGRG